MSEDCGTEDEDDDDDADTAGTDNKQVEETGADEAEAAAAGG
jgi:hypothetical protein